MTQSDAVQQFHAGLGRVVRSQRARGARRGGICFGQRLAQHDFDGRSTDLPWPQQSRTGSRAVDDGRLDADRAAPAVQHQQGRSEFLQHVGGSGRADTAKAVGAGRCHASHTQPRRGLQQR